MSYDADEILARMRADRESDWPERLLRSIAKAPIIEGPMPHGGRRLDAALSESELRIIQAASVGLSHAEIAVALGIGFETVKTTITLTRRKLRAKNTTHAVAIALREGLIA